MVGVGIERDAGLRIEHCRLKILSSARRRLKNVKGKRIVRDGEEDAKDLIAKGGW